jgi:hypothetical protein
MALCGKPKIFGRQRIVRRCGFPRSEILTVNAKNQAGASRGSGRDLAAGKGRLLFRLLFTQKPPRRAPSNMR